MKTAQHLWHCSRLKSNLRSDPVHHSNICHNLFQTLISVMSR